MRLRGIAITQAMLLQREWTVRLRVQLRTGEVGISVRPRQQDLTLRHITNGCLSPALSYSFFPTASGKPSLLGLVKIKHYGLRT
jgi:hypothetical protein